MRWANGVERFFGMEYVQLLGRLFLGSRPGTTADIDRLRLDSGITAVFNLQTDDDMRAVHLVWEPLEAHYRNLGIELCRMPVRDFDPVDLQEKLPDCVRALDHLLAANYSVYLHCTLGASRSPTVAIAYLHWCRGWDLERAVTYVKRHWQCSPNTEAIRLAVWDSSK
jgi:protein-tyrosine phosphatase